MWWKLQSNCLVKATEYYTLKKTFWVASDKPHTHSKLQCLHLKLKVLDKMISKTLQLWESVIPSVKLMNLGEVKEKYSCISPQNVFVIVCGGIYSHRRNQDHAHVQLQWYVEIDCSTCKGSAHVDIKIYVVPWHSYISSTCHQFEGS